MTNGSERVEEFVVKVEDIVRRTNAETKGVTTAASRKSIIKQVLHELDKEEQYED